MIQSVVTLRGPTASGKTDLAIDLSDRLPIEIVSVDSVMVYRGLNIGSAKPDQQTLENYPHHLIDICLLYTSPSPRDATLSGGRY